MAILSASKELHTLISSFSKSFMLKNNNFSFTENEMFIKLRKAIVTLLNGDDHVVLRNSGLSPSSEVFEAFIKSFEVDLGRYYGCIEKSGISLESIYAADDYKYLNLHNDNAVDLKNQPNYSFIQVVQEDPSGSEYAHNGIVKMDDVVNDLKASNPGLLHNLQTQFVPMLSYGVTVGSKDKSEILVNLPILTQRSDKVFICRFDYERILHYYFKKDSQGIPRSILSMIQSFLEVCEKHKKKYYLEEGDILIFNNLTTLHDRAETTMRLNIDGSLSTRKIMVSFII